MPQINQAETLVAFVEWIADRRGTLEVGENHDAQQLCDLLNEFLLWNDMEDFTTDDKLIDASLPPRLWFRYTPWVGSIEWAIRKLIHDATK